MPSDIIKYHHVSEVSSRPNSGEYTVSKVPNKTKQTIPWPLLPELRIQQPSKLINKPSDVGKRAFESPANLAVDEPRGQGSGVSFHDPWPPALVDFG